MIRAWVHDNGRAAPAIFCDHCGDMIAEAADGNCLWISKRAKKTEWSGELFFVHKKCSRAFEEKCPSLWSSWELSRFLYFLTRNLRYEPDPVRDAMMDDLP